MPSPRRLAPPWTVDEQTESFIIKDANGQPLAYVYLEDQPQRQMSMKRLTRDEAILVWIERRCNINYMVQPKCG